MNQVNRFAFADPSQPDLQDALAELAAQGIKTATSSLLASYTSQEQLPQVGDISVILNSKGQEICAITTTRVYITPFSQVSAEHAFKEGEGDRSLAFWRNTHEYFFRQSYGDLFNYDSPIVCEEFAVINLERVMITYSQFFCRKLW